MNLEVKRPMNVILLRKTLSLHIKELVKSSVFSRNKRFAAFFFLLKNKSLSTKLLVWLELLF